MKKLALVVAIAISAISVLPAADKDRKVEDPAKYETNVTFHNFPWGTSMEEVIKKMGKPVSREKINGLDSLVWENVEVKGYITYMLCYFNKSGLQGVTYYFLTYTMDELMQCYTKIRQELFERYGPNWPFDGITKELRLYKCEWNLPSGFVYLGVDTRKDDHPVTLWFSSPELSKQLFGDKPVTAKTR